ncbi:hypothetical protein Ais01nite_30750 [Asanoa ishikariensis]|uniref:Nitrate and nitrite sensing n=1 Tax=Asanoa ishikariensis TaxID=137265 RepID=A0A1H3UU72_9ACTN|nr:hypothetical protein [Asanoa ishikariensis]GIF65040.1 hypothetical protein Ais01nite_30750 [Asanoa ishikariensis]SDZ65990.1 hypothetical protein SAMN05421684_8072 [Asanoa ishikariensis]
MTRSAPRSRARTGALSVLLSILVVALLVPTALLFAQTWRTEGDRAKATERELDGVAYLRSLQQVAFAVADAQSAAVSGRPAPRDAIVVAVQQADATDAKLGGILRTTQRWTEIRSRMETLRDTPATADRAQALADYRELGDLVLALYAKVRDESGLVHDPDGDAFHLQNSAAGELPVAVISAGRLTDVAALAKAASSTPVAGQTPQQQAQRQLKLISQLAADGATLQQASTRLVNDLRSAVDSTESRTLGSNLLSRLDRYQRSADTMAAILAAATTAASGTPTPSNDQSILGVARGELQAAAGELYNTILNEVDRLLNARGDEIDQVRLRAVGAAGAAALIAIGLFLAYFLGGRPRRVRPTGPFPEGGPGALATDGATSWPTVAPITGAPYGGAPKENATQWERSGAAR